MDEDRSSPAKSRRRVRFEDDEKTFEEAKKEPLRLKLVHDT